MVSTRISPHSQTRNASNERAAGRLGQIFFDEQVGLFLSFTAAQTVGERIYLFPSGKFAGQTEFWEGDDSFTAIKEAYQLLRPIYLNSQMMIPLMEDVQRGIHSGLIIQIANGVENLIGTNVLISLSNGVETSFFVHSVNGRFRMPDPKTKKMTLYRNSIVLKNSNETPIKYGDAGALVVNSDRQAVGIVVAADETRVFVAPLNRLHAKNFFNVDDKSFAVDFCQRVKSKLLEEKNKEVKEALKIPEMTLVDGESAITRETLEREIKVFSKYLFDE